jgi:TonB family protein
MPEVRLQKKPDHAVTVLETTQGHGEGLDTQALAAVAGWRFKPAMKDGQAVAVLMNIEVSFRLQ